MKDREALVPLGFMCAGESGVLEEIRGLRRHIAESELDPHRKKPLVRYRRGHLFHSDRGHRLEHRLNYMGLIPGERLKVVQNSVHGPVIISVKGSRLCLSRGIAHKLMVRPETNGSTCEPE